MQVGDKREALKSVPGLADLWPTFLAYQQAKDAMYKSNWARRGLVGFVYGCLFRQRDRIAPVMKKVLRKGCGDNAVRKAFDTLLDTAMFSLMGIRLMAVYHPAMFDEFMTTLKSWAETHDEVQS